MSENDKQKERHISRIMAIDNMYETLRKNAKKLMEVYQDLVEFADGLWFFEEPYEEDK